MTNGQVSGEPNDAEWCRTTAQDEVVGTTVLLLLPGSVILGWQIHRARRGRRGARADAAEPWLATGHPHDSMTMPMVERWLLHQPTGRARRAHP
jgi:hypothetical protein